MTDMERAALLRLLRIESDRHRACAQAYPGKEWGHRALERADELSAMANAIEREAERRDVECGR